MSGHESAEPGRRAPAHARPHRHLVAWSALVAVALVALIVGAVATVTLGTPAGSAAPAPTPTQPATPPPLSVTQQMLIDSGDPTTCAVSFAGADLDVPPMLQHEGQLYTALPIPVREGAVFAGWYATPAGAETLAISDRVNGSELVACEERERTLYGAWTTPEANAAEDAQIPILMYHQFTTKPEGESGWLRLNYAYIGDFEQQMAYIADQGFYLPTWDELSAFIDGRLFLPNHSVIVTDDDADDTWYQLAVPVVDAHQVLTTSFMITRDRRDLHPSPYVIIRSHTEDMHRAGANGQGRMVNEPVEVIAADLEASAAYIGTKEVIAYPFGHYNDTAKAGVAAAGFELARTIEHGYVHIGSDKLALPVIRMNYGMTVDNLAAQIG